VIDFRYHLVSIVAVFLALAIGLVVGATALKPGVTAGLDELSRHEKAQISSQRTTINTLKNQIYSDQQFAQASAPKLLAGVLAGQQVVLVIAPGADGATVSGITADLKLSGAKVTGQAQLQPAFFDTSGATENSLDALAQRLVPPGVTLGSTPSLSSEVAGQQSAAQVIAAALLSANGADLPGDEARTILSGFAAQGYLQVSSSTGANTLPPATLAVVVIPNTPPSSGDSDSANLALLALARQLKAASRGVVLAGSYPGSGPGSAIDELIHGSAGFQVSSVDNANGGAGQIQVVWALAYALAGKKPAAYGIYAGAVPSPAPTPSATSSPSSSPSPTPTNSPKRKSGG
jgi:Copper transport outer membrane protein, MctB